MAQHPWPTDASGAGRCRSAEARQRLRAIGFSEVAEELVSELASTLEQSGGEIRKAVMNAAVVASSIAIDLGACPVDTLSLSAHKLYGPKGVGALVVRSAARVSVAPVIRGGGQERDLRRGTLNSPGIVAFGKAYELARERLAEDQARRWRR